MTPSGPDLLVQGDDAPPRRWGSRSRLAALLVLAVAVLCAAGTPYVLDRRAADERRRQAAADADAAPRLSLLPDQAGTPRSGPRPVGMHLVVGNEGPADLRLLSAQVLHPGWEVALGRRRLRAGQSVALQLVPPAACGLSPPRLLVLRFRLASGRGVTSVLDLTEAPLLYGGRLEQAVEALALLCDADVLPLPDRRTYPHRS